MIRPGLALAALLTCCLPASADPCGMVPPVFTGDGPAITRIGLQQTYVCFQNGIESFVIRPGYRGKVAEFGMLIPFPSPPAVRKVADDVFAHVKAAIDPPLIDPYPPMPAPMVQRSGGGGRGRPLEVEQVNVLREEAVGMYSVAVLEAGSAAALNRWMSDHGYSYPEGMDATCEDYIAKRWCFVAVKTQVGRKAAVQPQPGMREADTSLPEGAGFDGNVQAMGFRFRTKELVVPMRLSAFNEGDLRNVIYLLAPEPLKADRLPQSFVKRQVSGQELLANLTDPLPIQVRGRESGKVDVGFVVRDWASFLGQRDPKRANGLAKDLIASDLLATSLDRLANPHEEREKELLAVAERLGLRGEELDALHREALAAAYEAAADQALAGLAGMTLTVIDGDFPRQVLAEHDLTFTAWTLPEAVNTRAHYDCRLTQANKGYARLVVLVGRDTPRVRSAPRGAEIVGLDSPAEKED